MNNRSFHWFGVDLVFLLEQMPCTTFVFAIFILEILASFLLLFVSQILKLYDCYKFVYSRRTRARFKCWNRTYRLVELRTAVCGEWVKVTTPFFTVFIFSIINFQHFFSFGGDICLESCKRIFTSFYQLVRVAYLVRWLLISLRLFARKAAWR